MTYQEFKDYIYQEVASRYESCATVHLSTFTKNNGVLLDGLVICSKGSHVSPNIYLNDYFDLMEKGETKESILRKIIASYEKAKNVNDFDPEMLNDLSLVKDKIIFRLINKNANAVLLEDVPFIPFLDLAVVFSIMVDISEENCGTILIHNNLLELWDVSVEELFEIAKTNTYEALRPDCTPINEYIPGMVLDEDSNLLKDLLPTIDMYVLSNSKRFHGAGVICYPTFIKEIADRLEKDLFIIPSSIHEVLVLPMSDGMQLSEISELVRQVNATEVAPDEVLSNHAYYFLRTKNKIQY